MQFFCPIGVIILLIPFISQCGFGEKPEDEPRGPVVKDGTTSSTAIITATGLALPSQRGLSLIEDLGASCPRGVSYCLTPSDFSGKIYSLVIQGSAQSDGNDGQAFRLVSGGSGDDATANGLHDLDFSKALTLDDKFSCCDGVNFGEHSAYYQYVNIIPQYFDLTVNLTSIGIGADDTPESFETDYGYDPTAVKLRFVFKDVDDRGYKKGDILIHDGSEFVWCNDHESFTTEGQSSFRNFPHDKLALEENCQSTRPASPITQHSNIINYSDDLYSIPYFMASIFPPRGSGEPVASMPSKKDLLAHTWKYEFEFVLTDSLFVELWDPGQLSDHEQGIYNTPNFYNNIYFFMKLAGIGGLAARPSYYNTRSGGGDVGAYLTVTQTGINPDYTPSEE